MRLFAVIAMLGLALGAQGVRGEPTNNVVLSSDQVVLGGSMLVLECYVPPPTWTPAEIATVAWYDAADLSTITESDGDVSQWDDKSGNSRHIFQSVESRQPGTGTNTIGGLNALHFDGGDAFGTNNWGLSAGEWSFYVVANSLDAGGAIKSYLDIATGRMIFRQTDSTSPNGVMMYDGTFHVGANAFTGDQMVSFMAGDSGGIYTNGSLNLSAPSWTDKAIDGAITFGGNTAQNSHFCNAYLGEVVLVAGKQAQADRQIMEGYLAWKWGLEGDLPADHPYKDGAPTL